MEALSAISNVMTGGRRSPGWQVQVRVDYVVNQVMKTHRGQAEDVIKSAIQEQLRIYGVVPPRRQVDQYAAAISALPQLPPRR